MDDLASLETSEADAQPFVATAPPAPATPLLPGERYAGIALDTDGNPTHHLVLMPQQPENDVAWQAAMDWAISIGGTLPTRQEQALLFANCKPHLKPTWHWSSETHKDVASFAWLCHFYGYQHYYRKSYEGSAVAVRRLALHSFNPLTGVAA